MRKILHIMLIAAVIVVTGTGCSVSGRESHTYEEEKNMDVELTKRQISILEEANLPTDYDELSLNQKSAIDSIETILTYLEEKYDQPFTYSGYVAGGVLEKEHLMAYPSDGTPDDEITVYRTYVDGEFHYEDNYEVVQAEPLFEEAMQKFLSENADTNNAKIFCEVLAVNDGITRENVLKNCAGSVSVFLDEAYCTEEEFGVLLDKCTQLLRKNSNGMPCSIWIARTTEENLALINKENYENHFSKNIYSSENECTVSASGKINIY